MGFDRVYGVYRVWPRGAGVVKRASEYFINPQP